MVCRLLTGSLLFLALLIVATSAHAATALVHFKSAVYPYSISYPAGWRHVSGHLSGDFSLFPYDAFINPKPSHRFTVNVVIARIPLTGAATDSSFRQSNEQNLQSKFHDAHELGAVVVAGHRLILVAYGDTRAHTQAYLVEKNQGWVFSLTTALGDEARWRSVFVRMLGTFRFR